MAVQLAGQSQAIPGALHTGQKWDDALKAGTEPLPVRAVTELLRLAGQERRPVVVVLEQAQLCSDEWFMMLKRWEEEIGHSKWPVLLVVEWDHPHHLHAALPAVGTDLCIDWFRKVCIANDYRAGMVEVSPLTRADIDAILAPGSRHFAADLQHLSDGLPAIVQSVLSHWQTVGMATPDRDGRWHVHAGAGNVLPGALYDDLIMAPLARSAEIAQKLGYEQLKAEHLLEWLKYAVWEGDAFTDDALARAVGWHETEEAWESFQEILEEALCAGDDNLDGLIEFLEPVSLPYGDNQSRDFCRYRFRPPVVAAILRQRQDLGDQAGTRAGLCKGVAGGV
ncbi:MAG: hypothetical protein IPK16_05245 [Anaerolineales bacterium]|nr:hypothetical protein [Anaerolineales bacterium]